MKEKHMRRFVPIIMTVFIILGSCSPAPATASIPVATPSQKTTSTTAFIPCTILHVPLTPEAALGAEFENHGHIFGPTDAPVTIIVFSDYQCLQCAFLSASLRQIRLTHPNDVRIIYLHAPQTNRDKDNLAIQAVEAADLQGMFWNMHDLLFEKQAEWSKLVPANFESWAVEQAKGLGLNDIKFKSDFEGTVVADRVQQAIKFTASVLQFSPPLLFVNSASPYTSLADFASLDTVVRLDALAARQFSVCPPESIDPIKQYLVTLHTSKGDVELQLYPEKAPLAVNNFIFLAKSGWYNGITFYRVQPGERVMTGDPSETGLGNPGYIFTTEIATGLRFDRTGVVAMDNNGPDTNGSRFFISLASAPQLDGQYTIFGQVLSGLDILSNLSTRIPQPGIFLPPGDELINVTIAEH
jgi:cyclophilin family peptidyl-prolyl cis-trans isomerase/protein-disulfide isomerase